MHVDPTYAASVEAVGAREIDDDGMGDSIQSRNEFITSQHLGSSTEIADQQLSIHQFVSDDPFAA